MEGLTVMDYKAFLNDKKPFAVAKKATAAGAMLSQNDIAMHGLSTFIISVYMASTYSAQPTRVRLSRAS